MKTIKFFSVAMATLMFTSCGLLNSASSTSSSSTSTSTATTSTSTTSTTTSTGYSNGQTAGTAIKALVSQYKTDGKLDMTNVNNLLNITQLTASAASLRNKNKESDFYKQYVQGLILGSDNLVTEENSEAVMDEITTTLSNVDTSKVESAVSTGTTAVQNATSLASSVTSLISLFK